MRKLVTWTGLAGGVAFLLALIVTAVGPAGAADDRRYALVIGNSSYYSVPALSSPVNDASDVGGSLAKVGFEVTYGLDLNLREFWSMVQQFAAISRDGSAVVFYYAGHGFQMQSANYLVPVDAALKTRESIPVDNIDLNAVISMLQQEGRPTIILLDACRNSPLPAELRSASRQEGLMELQTGRDVFVAFATAPGKTAGDGIGRNSPFAQALLNHVRRPGLGVSEMMVDLRRDVFAATEGKQVPWDQSSLRRQFYFVPTASVPDSMAQRSSPSTGQPAAPQTKSQDSVIEKEAPPETGTTTATQPPTQTPPAPPPETPEVAGTEKLGSDQATANANDSNGAVKRPGTSTVNEKAARAREKEREAANAKKQRTAAEARKRAVEVPARRARDRNRTVESSKSGGKRPDAFRYSYSIWPQGTLRAGHSASKKTSHGTLTCRGQIDEDWFGDERIRMCKWQ